MRSREGEPGDMQMNTASNVWGGVTIPLAAPFALSDLLSPEWVQILFAVRR